MAGYPRDLGPGDAELEALIHAHEGALLGATLVSGQIDFQHTLRNVIVPKRVTVIDDGAFSGCARLTSVVFEARQHAEADWLPCVCRLRRHSHIHSSKRRSHFRRRCLQRVFLPAQLDLPTTLEGAAHVLWRPQRLCQVQCPSSRSKSRMGGGSQRHSYTEGF